MIKIQPGQVKYIVKKDDGVVICIIEGTKWLAHELIYCYYDRLNYSTDEEMLKMNDSFTGIARLAEGDVWDEEYGKLLAYDRAKYKLTQSIFKHVQNFVSNLEKETDDLVDGVNSYFDKVTHNKNYREKRLNKEVEDAES